jgi:hypothetical protein
MRFGGLLIIAGRQFHVGAKHQAEQQTVMSFLPGIRHFSKEYF